MIMKKILLFAVAAVATVTVQAQSVQFVYEGRVLENGAVVEVFEYDEMMYEMPWHVGFKNNTGADVEVIMSHVASDNKYPDLSEILGDPSFKGLGDGLSLCVAGACRSGEVAVADPFIVDATGTPNTDVHAAFAIMSEMILGVTDAYVKAEYRLENAADEEDYTYVTVIFDYAKYKAAVNAALMANNVKVYQRGANLVCDYAFDAVAPRTLVVTNIVGARVASVALDANNGEVMIQSLPKGVYVYTVVENGRNLKSQKIVVR